MRMKVAAALSAGDEAAAAEVQAEAEAEEAAEKVKETKKNKKRNLDDLDDKDTGVYNVSLLINMIQQFYTVLTFHNCCA